MAFSSAELYFVHKFSTELVLRAVVEDGKHGFIPGPREAAAPVCAAILFFISLLFLVKNTKLVRYAAHNSVDETITLSKFAPIGEMDNSNKVNGTEDSNYSQKGELRWSLTFLGGVLLRFVQLCHKNQVPQKHCFQIFAIMKFSSIKI